MRVIVTGAGGLIGKAISLRLKEEKYEIWGIGTKKRDDQFYISTDISGENSIKEISDRIPNADVLIHCAAHISYGKDENRLLSVNVNGTWNMLKLAEQLNVKHFIYISGVPIVGTTKQIPITLEGEKPEPKTLYHLSKYFGEQLVDFENVIPQKCILRICAPISEDMPENRMIKLFVKNAVMGKDIHLHGKGGRIQTYTHIRDIAECIFQIIQKKVTGKYILGGESYSNREIAQKCIEICHSSSRLITDDKEIEEDKEKWILDNSFMEKVLQYKIKYPLEKTIEEIRKQYENMYLF